MEENTVPEGAAGLRGFVAPRTLLSEVRNTAPWLPKGAGSPEAEVRALARGEFGFRNLLTGFREGYRGLDGSRILDYFALCLACHHATVATFVPTDVDTKIRGLLWRLIKDPSALDAMVEMTEAFCGWDVPSVSKRTVSVDTLGTFSGHDGERLSVLGAALGRCIHLGRDDLAVRVRGHIDRELDREARALQTLIAARQEIDALKMAAVMTHNAGDIDQAISFWPQSPAHTAAAAQIRRLAHENVRPWNGRFALAARIYKPTLAPEGHRNYPLREVKALRGSFDFLIETAPFLDAWGARLGGDDRLSEEDKSALLEALISGCQKILGQRGYQRAIAGLSEALGSRLDAVVSKMPARARNAFKDAGLRKALAVARGSFESSLKSMLRKALE